MTRPRDLSVAVGAMAVAKEQVTEAAAFAVEQVVVAVVRAVMCMRWCGEVRSQGSQAELCSSCAEETHPEVCFSPMPGCKALKYL